MVSVAARFTSVSASTGGVVAPRVSRVRLSAFGWVSDVAVRALSEACPDAVFGKKKLNPSSSQAARMIECKDIPALRFETSATVPMLKIALSTGPAPDGL
jgi:hypothetical protein